jgi:hypothetical protein
MKRTVIGNLILVQRRDRRAREVMTDHRAGEEIVQAGLLAQRIDVHVPFAITREDKAAAFADERAETHFVAARGSRSRMLGGHDDLLISAPPAGSRGSA